MIELPEENTGLPLPPAKILEPVISQKKQELLDRCDSLFKKLLGNIKQLKNGMAVSFRLTPRWEKRLRENSSRAKFWKIRSTKS